MGYLFDFLLLEGRFWFLLEPPYRGDSNEYTQYIIFNIKKKIILNYPKSAEAMGFFLGTEERVRNSLSNEPSVFEPLKVYCISNAIFK